MENEIRELALCFYRLYLKHKRKTTKNLREILMADFSKLEAVNASSKDAIATLKTDAEALIAKVGVEDPAIQQNIDASVVAAQENLDATNAIDAEVKAKLA